MLRYLTSVTMQKLINPGIFPIGTFCVNMIGCLLIGFIAQLSEARAVFAPEMRIFLMIGILGGFTTFSSFGYETVQLIRDGEFLLALGNAGGQLVLGLVMVWLGYVLARLI
ncbi:MAG: fluoride efflux transporter CrcB [Candidatus Obscuribacterales bacterium]|nr:fluoride efflux transporter CrcB [Candidatus Obscuribacterales bacterium]